MKEIIVEIFNGQKPLTISEKISIINIWEEGFHDIWWVIGNWHEKKLELNFVYDRERRSDLLFWRF